MMESNDRHDGSSRVIETASGTTSPDNAKSGHFAYVIAGIAIVVSLLFGLSVSGCMSFVGDLIVEEYGGEQYEYYDDYDQFLDEYFDDDYDEYDYDDDGHDLYLDWDDEMEHDGSALDGATGSISVGDALAYDLAIYGDSIETIIPAFAYANAQESVRTFVRDTAKLDGSASSEIAGLLQGAAWGGDVSEALASASTIAEDTLKALRDMELPKPDGSTATSVSRNLEVGKTHAVKRWEAISSALALLAEGDSVEADELGDLDEDVYEEATEASEAFVDALTESANRS